MRLFCGAHSERVRSGRRACPVQAPCVPAPVPPFPGSLPVAALRPFPPGRVLLFPSFSSASPSLSFPAFSWFFLRFPAFSSFPPLPRRDWPVKSSFPTILSISMLFVFLKKSCKKVVERFGGCGSELLSLHPLSGIIPAAQFYERLKTIQVVQEPSIPPWPAAGGASDDSDRRPGKRLRRAALRRAGLENTLQ